MAIAEVSIIPIGTDNPSVSKYVAKAINVLQQKEAVNYELTSMGTIIEGDLKDILDVITKMHETPFILGAKRVVTNIKIDDRRDKIITSSGKIESVKQKLDM